jgi:Leucine-rich repeat (LRR) protein
MQIMYPLTYFPLDNITIPTEEYSALEYIFALSRSVDVTRGRVSQAKDLDYEQIEDHYKSGKIIIGEFRPGTIYGEARGYTTQVDASLLALQLLSEKISSLKFLEELSLAHNELSALPDSIASLNKLTTLDLRYNQFKETPRILTKVRNLKKLYVCGNQITMDETLHSLRQGGVQII